MSIFRKLFFFHLPVFLLMAVLAFLAVQYAPGDPAKAAVTIQNEELESSSNSTADQESRWNRSHHLDKPIFYFSVNGLSENESSWKYWIPVIGFNESNRFSIWLFGDGKSSAGILHGDFGYSFRTRKAVSDIILDGIRNTSILSIFGLSLACLIAVPLGLFIAGKKGSALEKTIDTFSLMILAIPLFWTATVLAMVFTDSNLLGWLPSPGSWPVGDQTGEWKHWILPILCFSFLPTAFLTRWMNDTAKTELAKEYIKTARAKGTPNGRILYGHVLRNLAPELLAILGHLTVVVLSGTVLIETIFVIPGIGWSTFQAVESKDLPVLTALVLTYMTIAIVAYTVSDLLSMRIDKRRSNLISKPKPLT